MSSGQSEATAEPGEFESSSAQPSNNRKRSAQRPPMIERDVHGTIGARQNIINPHFRSFE